MKRVNSEQYRIERSVSQPPGSKNNNSTHKNVTRKREKIRLTQRYKILGATDPNTRINYNLNEMLAGDILNKFTSTFFLPSTCEFCHDWKKLVWSKL